MGGIGSGRRTRVGTRPLTTDLRAIDIRHWKRAGLLEPGRHFAWQWMRGGTALATIHVRIEAEAEAEAAILAYRCRPPGGDWQDMRYAVGLDYTPCHLGGSRPWFLCPARGCGARAALLYGGTVFACRHCHGLAYPSQNEDEIERLARRAERIRDRLGWPGGILNGTRWEKPKGMHWATFERLCARHDALAEASLNGMARKLGLEED